MCLATKVTKVLMASMSTDYRQYPTHDQVHNDSRQTQDQGREQSGALPAT